jgi:redox-sensitive bicupin YhaK (pirin superfamily)
VSEADVAPVEAADTAADSVVEVLESRTADVAGTPVRRALPRRARRTIGAWCFLDHFRPTGPSDPPGMIGPHPHIGLQTVTWLVDGESLHTDSLGSEQLIRPGQLNLMTAGHGVAHAEDGREWGSAAHGVQLWIALPDSTRDGDAGFEHHADLPRAALAHGEAVVLVGELAGETSPARHDTPLLGAELRVDGPIELPLEPAFEHGFVVIDGGVTVDGVGVGPDALVYLGDGRDEIELEPAGPTRLLLFGGEPFGEILMWWNFVARTRDEMELAYRDWQSESERFGPVASDLPRMGAPRPGWMPSDAR